MNDASLPEAAGEFIRGLPMAVISSVFASMLVSLTVVPFLASKVLKTNHDPRGNIFLRGLQKLISGSYTKLLDRALKHPVITLLIAFSLFGASLFVFGIIGFRIFPTSEKPQFLINVNMPLQSNLEATDRMARDMAIELKPHNVASMSLWQGFTFTERAQENLKKVSGMASQLNSAAGTSVEFPGRVIAALAEDPEVLRRSGGTFITAELAQEYGITDIDGRVIPSLRAQRGAPIWMPV